MTDIKNVLAGLNEEQRQAAREPRSGRHPGRCRHRQDDHDHASDRVPGRDGHVPADKILAVTFTEKAAGELRAGSRGSASTAWTPGRSTRRPCRSSAGSGPRFGEPVPAVLDHKAPLISSLANALPAAPQVPAAARAGRRDRVGEEPHGRSADYLAELGRPRAADPARPDAPRVRGLRAAQAARGEIDFEDMLGLASGCSTVSGGGRGGPRAVPRVHRRRVPGREPVAGRRCSTAGSATATTSAWSATTTRRSTRSPARRPTHLLGFTDRFPKATVVRLERELPLDARGPRLANQLADPPGRVPQDARGDVASGPPLIARPIPTRRPRSRRSCRLWASCTTRTCALEQIAVLYRINARSEPFEEAFAAAGIPYQVRDGAFLRRPGPRAVLQRLKRPARAPWPRPWTAITDELGYDPEAAPDADEEVTRQSDLGRMRRLAEEFERAHPDGDAAAFVEELARRFSTEHSGRGVNLLTYHRAKGLEFDAVFLPRLLDGELPFRSGRAKADPEEERRLLYVGITRARTLPVPHVADRRPRAAEPVPGRDGARAAGALGAEGAPRPARTACRGGGLFDRLKEWRRKRAPGRRRAGVRRVPRPNARRDRRTPCKDWADLAAISGVGPGQARAIRGRGARGRRGGVTRRSW